MDRKLAIETASLVLLIIAFPIISVGTNHDVLAVWLLGFAGFVVASALPIMTRFQDHSADEITDVGMEYDERVS